MQVLRDCCTAALRRFGLTASGRCRIGCFLDGRNTPVSAAVLGPGTALQVRINYVSRNSIMDPRHCIPRHCWSGSAPRLLRVSIMLCVRIMNETRFTLCSGLTRSPSCFSKGIKGRSSRELCSGTVPLLRKDSPSFRRVDLVSIAIHFESFLSDFLGSHARFRFSSLLTSLRFNCLSAFNTNRPKREPIAESLQV